MDLSKKLSDRFINIVNNSNLFINDRSNLNRILLLI